MMVVIAEACPPPDTGRGRGPTRSVGRGRSEAERNGVLRNIHYDPKRKYNRKGGQSVGLVNHLFVVCYFLFP